MYNNLIDEQLKKVTQANLSNYDKENNTYIIPKKLTIKIEEDCCYLIKLLPASFTNDLLRVNFNNGKSCEKEYLKIDVSKKMSNLIKVVGVGYDIETKECINYFWSGWLNINELEVIQKID